MYQTFFARFAALREMLFLSQELPFLSVCKQFARVKEIDADV
jgi:hypothetical protein